MSMSKDRRRRCRVVVAATRQQNNGRHDLSKEDFHVAKFLFVGDRRYGTGIIDSIFLTVKESTK